MSLRIIRPGVLDTIQDGGRYGYQHQGINPGGVMDHFSGRLANALLGKDLNAAVLELHFPSSRILFEEPTVITLCGADFQPILDGETVPLDHPIAVNAGSRLIFEHINRGARCYLSFWNDLQSNCWMNSHSTNLKARMGGFGGRSLQKDDVLSFEGNPGIGKILRDKKHMVLPWKSLEKVDTRNEIEFIIGSEWHQLNAEGQETFQNSWFQVTAEADRMGYRLAGPSIEIQGDEQLISSAVSFGTVQLLPGGQIIILMADHQTTGGYPRIAHVISAHLPLVSQKKPNDVIRFKMTTLAQAELKLMKQYRYLIQLQEASQLKMEEWLKQ